MLTETLTFLKQNSDALTVIFSAVVTFSTVVYAVLTAILVNETQKMRAAQTEPKIHISLDGFDFSINHYRLKIENIGLGPAFDISFSGSVTKGGKIAERLLHEFMKPNFLKDGLCNLGPNAIVYSRETTIVEDFEGKMASEFSFTIKYKSALGQRYVDQVAIKMSDINGRYQIGTPNFHSMANSLEKISKNLDHLIRDSKLDVKIHSSSDQKKEQKKFKENQQGQTRKDD